MRRSFRRGSAWDADLLADQARSCPALDGKPCRRSGPLLTDANAVSVVLPPAAGGRACGGGGVRETGAPAHSARSGSPFHSPAATARFDLPNIDGEPLWLSAGCLPVVHLAGYLGTVGLWRCDCAGAYGYMRCLRHCLVFICRCFPWERLYEGAFDWPLESRHRSLLVFQPRPD